jgi:four helix bundle protein
MVNSFRDLRVWQKSVELAIAVDRLTESFPREETYGISAQMRRCAVSIPSNIAEGNGRLTRRD